METTALVDSMAGPVKGMSHERRHGVTEEDDDNEYPEYTGTGWLSIIITFVAIALVVMIIAA